MLTALLLSVAQAAPAAPPDARGAIAIYCPAQCADVRTSLPVLQRSPLRAREASVSVERWDIEEFGIPDAEQRAGWGQGDLSGLQAAQDVVVLSWAAPTTEAAAAVSAAGAAALTAGQWYEDLDTGIIYDATELRTQLGRYAGEQPDITALTVIEGAPDGDENIRLVTRGLGKVGLPELVYADVAPDDANAAGLTLTAVAQILHERGLESTFDLDGAAIRSPAVRALACGVRGTVRLKPAEAAADDPLGPLSIVRFEGEVQGCDPAAVAPTPAPPEQMSPTTLEEARSQARARLMGPVRDAFAVGLSAEEALLVKAPFKGPRGRTEWMWVTVSQWRADGTMIGTLSSSPSLVTDLRRGDTVTIQADRTFDYILVHRDGKREGNTTGPFLR
jgi:uncharacterized protein YegJ (DUF2314 family)